MDFPAKDYFHPCYYKKHKAYACMPPVGTVVIDPLQVPEVVDRYGKFLTPEKAANVDLRKYYGTNGVSLYCIFRIVGRINNRSILRLI